MSKKIIRAVTVMKIFRIPPLKFVNKPIGLFAGTLEDYVHVVGHEDEAQYNYARGYCDNSNIIHPNLKILVISEPNSLRKMIGCN